MVDTRRLEQLVGDRAEGDRAPRRAARPFSPGALRGSAPGGARGTRNCEAADAAWAALRTVEPAAAPPPSGSLRQTLARAEAEMAAFDMLRAQMLQALRTRGWHSIGVSAPMRGCGASFVSVALARSFARLQNVRTVLLDLDVEGGSVGDAFGLVPQGRITDMIVGDVPAREHLCALAPNLALGLTLPCREGGASLFQNGAFAQMLDDIRTAYRPDVILCDLPPLLTGDGAIAALPSLDGVLVVADGSRTQARDLLECERLLQERTQLLGVVLNRSFDRQPGLWAPG